MTIRLGIIGSGSIGNMHADAAVGAGTSLVGCCDLDLAKAKAIADRIQGCTAYDSAEAMLASDDIDAAVVCVPNAYHKTLALAVIAAGKDLLLEKPMAMNVAECREIVAAARASDRIAQVNFVCRRSNTSVAAKKMIDAGRLGHISHAKAILHRRRGIPGLGRWFTTRAVSGGGVLIDLGVHMIDLVRYLTGSPTAVRVSGTCTTSFGTPMETYTFQEMWSGPPDLRGTYDVEDAAMALIRFDNGLTLDLSLTWASNLPEEVIPNGVYLYGDEAGCFFDVWGERMELGADHEGTLVDLKPRCETTNPWMDGWIRQHRNFAENVESRTRPDASVDDGLAVQAILDAIYRSAGEGREVEIEAV